MVSEETWGVTTGPEHLAAPGTAVSSLLTKTPLQACKCSILVIGDKTKISKRNCGCRAVGVSRFFLFLRRPNMLSKAMPSLKSPINHSREQEIIIG